MKKALPYILSWVFILLLFAFEDFREGVFWLLATGLTAEAYIFRYLFFGWIAISIMSAIYHKVTGKPPKGGSGGSGGTIGWPDRSDR